MEGASVVAWVFFALGFVVAVSLVLLILARFLAHVVVVVLRAVGDVTEFAFDGVSGVSADGGAALVAVNGSVAFAAAAAMVCLLFVVVVAAVAVVSVAAVVVTAPDAAIVAPHAFGMIPGVVVFLLHCPWWLLSLWSRSWLSSPLP